ALPLVAVGLFLTAQGNVQIGDVGSAGTIAVIVQPLFQLFMFLIPIPEGVALHPTAFAAWVGLLVTAINLLPAGQLDGGHIARGLLGERSRYLSYATIAALFIMSMFYVGWMFFAILIFILGLRHPAPLNDISKIDNKRKAVGIVALVILLVTFVPVPVVEIPADYQYEITLDDTNETTVLPGESAVFRMTVNNTGNTDLSMRFSATQVPLSWGAILYFTDGSSVNATNTLLFPLSYGTSANVTMEVLVPVTASSGARTIVLETRSQGKSESVDFSITVSG
ncbi:MAG: hypothetical protein FJ151_01080, partial [Euryarchaeota archaeon]|nr:hypothetical protein [Euryarchaeota archaeon]